MTKGQSHEHSRIPGQGAAASFGVPVPAGVAGLHGREGAKRRRSSCRGPLWVVKAQIHAGGRGKGKFKELAPTTRAACASPSRSTRSKPTPRRCSATRSSPSRPAPPASRSTASISRTAADIAREFYLALLVDRDTGAHRLRRLDRRRHGHRGGRARHAREDPHASQSIPPPASCRYHGRRVAFGARARRASWSSSA